MAADVSESPELDRWQDHADADGPPADDVASLLRRGHPLAVRMFRVLEDRPDVDVREVLLAAVALQAPGSSERVAAAWSRPYGWCKSASDGSNVVRPPRRSSSSSRSTEST